jgi:hypothetical protein
VATYESVYSVPPLLEGEDLSSYEIFNFYIESIQCYGTLYDCLALYFGKEAVTK